MPTIEPWFIENRRDLPWRQQRSPYRVWLSEIMLQQTQVTTVIDYFNRFMTRFPAIRDLASAPEDEVMALWSGLGYYSRARNLHRAAKMVVREYGGEFPADRDELLRLPGVGSYTAGAILAFAFNINSSVVDGNIARVLARYFNDDTEWNTPAGKRHFESISLNISQQAHSPSNWHEGLMELGATICRTKNPQCELCPLETSCQSRRAGTTAQLPRRAAKRARTSLKLVCAIVRSGHYVWLEKNVENRLFGGLYVPPNQVVSDEHELGDAMTDLLSSRDLNDCSVAPTPIVVERTLTHRDLMLFGFLAHANTPPYDDSNWVHQNDLGQLGIPGAFRILLDRCFDRLA